MSKRGEIEYLKKIGESGIKHAINKPFSDDMCARYFFELGAIFSLLPPLPAKLLDLGCGTGWTSVFFAKRGYDVTGTDIAPDMISNAIQLKENSRLVNLSFMTADYETMEFEEEFDAVLFFDSLHHAVDEKNALQSAYMALKENGICITVEPGSGHHNNLATRKVIEKYDTTEKDMDPAYIKTIGRLAGFRIINVYPPPDSLRRIFYQDFDKNLVKSDYEHFKKEMSGCVDNREFYGLVVLRK
jgi:ubiquinone/menaquinone biosynthesis C-methylase UbiE